MNIASLGQQETSTTVSQKPLLTQQYSPQRKKLPNPFKINLMNAQLTENIETPLSSKKWAIRSASSHIDDDTTSNFTGYGVVPFKQSAGQGATQHARALKQREKELQTYKIQDKNSVKAIYGKRGFLNFLQNIFVYLTDTDKHQINFYFTIRDRIIDYCDQLGSSSLEMTAGEQDRLFNHIRPRDSRD